MTWTRRFSWKVVTISVATQLVIYELKTEIPNTKRERDSVKLNEEGWLYFYSGKLLCWTSWLVSKRWVPISFSVDSSIVQNVTLLERWKKIIRVLTKKAKMLLETRTKDRRIVDYMIVGVFVWIWNGRDTNEWELACNFAGIEIEDCDGSFWRNSNDWTWRIVTRWSSFDTVTSPLTFRFFGNIKITCGVNHFCVSLWFLFVRFIVTNFSWSSRCRLFSCLLFCWCGFFSECFDRWRRSNRKFLFDDVL